MRRRRTRLRWSLALAAVGCAACSDANAETTAIAEPAPQTPIVELRTLNARFSIDTATLEIQARLANATRTPVASPVFEIGEATVALRSPAAWTLSTVDQNYAITAATDGDALTLSIAAAKPGWLRWPRIAGVETVSAYALPIFGEGRYVPANDPDWVSFLVDNASEHSAEGLSLPLWTEMRPGASLTWIVEAPFDTHLVFGEEDGRLTVGLDHEFSPLDPDADYRLRIAFGPDDPIAGAKLYRDFLRKTSRLRSLDEKAAANPNITLLAGAPHIYLWERGPLKPEDITAWRRLIRLFGAHRDAPDTLSGKLWAAIPKKERPEVEAAIAEAGGRDGFVSRYNRSMLTRALNRALPRVLPVEPVAPLPGGHDPYAQAKWSVLLRDALDAEFGGCFAPPERWGGGLSLQTIEALQDAGIQHAWLGAESWLDVLWHPEAAQAAKDAGYLLAAYDSYGSAHPTSLADTWDTAQMGDAVFETAGYRDADGDLVVGFAGRGVYANPLAIAAYARKRIAAIAGAAKLNSYFLDVDATGENSADYTGGRRTSRREVEEALRERLSYPSDTLGLVTGSEGGVSLFAPEIAYAHGMTTVPFKWTDRRMKFDRDSEYFVGGYWPPEAPDIFFKSTPLPEEARRRFFAPEFRLPLYEAALHDSVVSTHHWEYPSLKFIGQRDRTALLQMLYMIPPLYHLSTQTLDRDLPAIARYVEAFAPVHAALYNKEMTAFRFLSEDRLLQQTEFAGGATITANFDSTPRTAHGGILPPMSARVTGLGEDRIVLGGRNPEPTTDVRRSGASVLRPDVVRTPLPPDALAERLGMAMLLTPRSVTRRVCEGLNP